jgi:hypothetical protein
MPPQKPPLLPCAVVAPFKEETSPSRVSGIHMFEVDSGRQMIKLASAEDESNILGSVGEKWTVKTQSS